MNPERWPTVRPEALVLAKAPVPGHAKTRLCPPLSLDQAAMVAEAALIDTLVAVSASAFTRRTLVLDGAPGPWLVPGFRVVPQVGRGLDVRLAEAFRVARGPALLVGMDTPQVDPALLDQAGQLLGSSGVDAVLGPAEDGGWWIIGLRRPDPRVFIGVPMSSRTTGVAQRHRLEQLGLRCVQLPTLRDVDRFEDGLAVARLAPGTRFARVFGQAVHGTLVRT
jgi:rSAM/selenodomain-associated transferase 1